MPKRLTITTLVLALIWLVALPALALSLIRADRLRVDIGAWGDHAVLQGANGPEESSTENYRWTTDEAMLRLPNLSASYRLLALRAHGWRPDSPSPRVRLDLGGRPWGEFQTTIPLRIYQVLLPSDPLGRPWRIELSADRYAPPGDPRVIGIAIDWVELRALGNATPFPSVWQLGGQALLLALTLACLSALAGGVVRNTSTAIHEGHDEGQVHSAFRPLRALSWIYPRLVRSIAVAAAGLASGLVALNLAEPLWVGLALELWLVLAGILLLALLIAGPPLGRALQPWLGGAGAGLAVALLAVGLALRLAGAIHPFFDAHDLPVHDRWMRTVAGGQLYLYSTPGELQNRLTFNPPAGYLLLLPAWLAIPDLRLTIQAGTALIDGLGCLALLGLAYELRMGRRAALIALALYTALPINLTILWWGFAANDIAQTLWMLLLWLILRHARVPTGRGIALIAVAAGACALTHVGALVLVAAMLGLLALGGLFALPRRTAMVLIVALVGVVLIAAPIYFSAAAAPVLAQSPDPRARTLAESLARSWSMRDLRLTLVGRAFVLGFTLPLLALIPAGACTLLIRRTRHPLQRWLLGGWALVSVTFFGIYMTLGFLTRYIYFAAPLICLAGGIALAPLWRRPAGRAFALALILVVALAGIALWWSGVLLRDKPSLVPLTQ